MEDHGCGINAAPIPCFSCLGMRYFMQVYRKAALTASCRLQKLLYSVRKRLLLRLEVVEQDVALLRLLTPVANDDAGTVDDFARVALSIELA